MNISVLILVLLLGFVTPKPEEVEVKDGKIVHPKITSTAKDGKYSNMYGWKVTQSVKDYASENLCLMNLPFGKKNAKP